MTTLTAPQPALAAPVDAASPTTTCRPARAATAHRPASAAAVLCDRDPYRHLEPALVRLTAMDPDDPERVAVRNELAVAFAPVCRNVARRFARQGEPTEDLEQVATIGLLKALEHFKPVGFDPITAFVGYAVPTIAGEIQRYLRDHTWVVRVPRPIKEIQARLWRAVVELSAEHGRPPRPSELAARLGVERELVVEALGAPTARRPRSTDAPVGIGGERLADGLSYVDEALTSVDCRAELREALALLPARTVQIIAMRFFRGMTQTQIAAELGISQMHVSRLLGRALTTLRAVMTVS